MINSKFKVQNSKLSRRIFPTNSIRAEFSMEDTIGTFVRDPEWKPPSGQFRIANLKKDLPSTTFRGDFAHLFKKKVLSINNCLFKTFKSGAGFTLIELLAVVIVFMAIGIIITAILFASFRGTNKTNTLTSVRQNGNYALGQMEKTIRNAKNFDGVSVTGTDDSFTTNCTQIIPAPPAATPTPVEYKFIKVTSFDAGQTTFACCPLAGSDQAMISSSSASPACLNKVNLLDQSAVALSDCKFTCTQTSATDFPIIGIDFSLIQAGQDLVQEKTVSPIPFQTSVMMRNLKR